MPVDKILQDMAGGRKGPDEIATMITSFAGVGTPTTPGSVMEAAPFVSGARGLSVSVNHDMEAGTAVPSNSDNK